MKKWLIGVLIGVLVLGAGGVGYAAYKVAQKGNEQDRRAQVVSQSRAVDEKLQQIWDRLELRDAAWESATEGSGGSVASTLDLTATDIKGLRTLINDARADAKKIPSDKVAAAYGEVCNSLSAAVIEAEEGAAKAKPIGEAYDLVLSCYDDAGNGHEAINASVEACNKKKWSEAKTKAKAAEASFKAIKTKLVKVNGLHPDASVKSAYTFSDAGVSYAQMEYQLAVLGTNGGVSSYNAQIRKLEAQQTKVNDYADRLTEVEVKLSSAMDEAYGDFVARATPANTLWTKAKAMVVDGAF